MTALTQYVDAWVANDADRIALSVAEHCVVVESYGPVYRGRATVRRWAEAWFAAGGVVHSWDLADHLVVADREVAEWTFTCTWEGERSTFDGATVARCGDSGLILGLREYQTAAPLYDWQGTWR